MKNRLHLMLLLLLTSCPGPEPVGPPVPPSGCHAACQHLRQLVCELGRTTTKGATCEDWCGAAEQNGVNPNTGCLSSAATCEAADAC